MLKGAPVERSDSVTLSLDGKDCTAGRCGFQARRVRPTGFLLPPAFQMATNSASSLLALAGGNG